MADVLMVFPKSEYLEKAMIRKYAPLAFLSIATYAHKEFSIKLIDQRIDDDWEKHLMQELRKNPMCVAITSYTGDQIINALEISKIVKENSTSKVVWGGTHASILPGQTLDNKYVDYVIEGEGEISFYEFLKALKKEKNVEKTPGLWYKKNGKTYSNPAPKLVDLNQLPELPYELLGDIENYVLRFDGERMFIMESARGCPSRCTFCYVQSLDNQRDWRVLTPEKTIEKMLYFKEKFNVKGIEFQDLTSFVNMPRMLDFAKLMVKEDVDMFWNTCGRITDVARMDDDYLKWIEKSQMRRFAMGVESGSDRILKMIRKGINLRLVHIASKKLSKTEIPPIYSFMAGFPTETEKELKMTVDLVMHLLKENPRAKTTIIHNYRPLPGNELYDLAKQNGFVEPTSLEEWGKFTMDWNNHPWLNDSMRKKISAINFLSLFLDKKYEEIDAPAVQLFSKLYQPIAKYRMNNHKFGMMFEPLLKDAYVSLKS